jgi:hypothetical protein
VPVQRIVWTGKGVKVYDPNPTDAEACELFGGRNGVSGRIVKVFGHGLIPRLTGRQQELVILTFKKRAGEPPVERVVRKKRGVEDFA